MKTASTRRTRRATTLAALAAATLVVSGCMVSSPQTTMLNYAPADGVEMDGSDLVARDVLVVSHGNGAPGVVSGTLVNQGTEPLTVTITVAGQPAGEVTIEPGTSVRLDGGTEGGTRTTLESVEGPAGEGVEVRLSGGADTLAATAPVLLPQGPYADFADDAGGTVEPRPEAEESDH